MRWCFITHCGYSWLVVYLKCSTNNLATTVYDSLIEATRRHRIPSRVRCDQGRENIRVGQFMLERRGCDCGSISNMHCCATQLFYQLFYFLEHNALLDPIKEQHPYALHFIFLPRVNRAWDRWNQHGIRIEGNHSPQ